jgi:hypothetical protein
MGRFPASITNTGEAWIGRASDRSAGTMTVQLGGNSASGRVFEVVDYAWSVVLFSVGSNGNVAASGTISASNFSGSSSGTNTGDQTNISGNAATATILQTARTLTIGGTGKAFNGSANVAWSLSEIGVPSKSGEGAIGTWGINISGNAATATSAGNADTVDGFHVSVAGTANTIPTRDASGYFIPANWTRFDGVYGLYSPINNAHLRPNDGSYGSWLITGSRNGWRGLEFDSGTAGNVSIMISANSNTAGFHNNNYGWQFYWEGGTLYCFKNTYGAGTQATVLDSSNYNSYAPTLTGGGASGTWGISITGNAATATNVAYSGLTGTVPTWNQNTTGNAATATEVVRTVAAGSDANLVSATIADNDFFRIRTGGPSNAGFVEIATADDSNEPIYVRQYTGTFTSLTRTATILDGSGNTSFPGNISAANLSGTNTGDQTNISGNAATATALSSGQSNWLATGVLNNVVGLLAWKNYSNGHVIFDASASNSPSGSAINNTNPQNNWSPTFPTLMGWNGSNTYGVRVDSARVADSANSVAWTNVSGRPTALSAFTNDTGFISNSSDAFPSIPRTNFIVTLTAAEYAALSPKQTDTLYVVV